jgi:hypothetical protein
VFQRLVDAAGTRDREQDAPLLGWNGRIEMKDHLDGSVSVGSGIEFAGQFHAQGRSR